MVAMMQKKMRKMQEDINALKELKSPGVSDCGGSSDHFNETHILNDAVR
jgi:hypothetical protein